MAADTADVACLVLRLRRSWRNLASDLVALDPEAASAPLRSRNGEKELRVGARGVRQVEAVGATEVTIGDLRDFSEELGFRREVSLEPNLEFGPLLALGILIGVEREDLCTVSRYSQVASVGVEVPLLDSDQILEIKHVRLWSILHVLEALRGEQEVELLDGAI